MPELVLVETAAGVRRITMHRPEARNALSSALMAELAAAFVAAEEAEEVDVVVFTGTDPAFCAGLDLRELGQGGANLRGGADAAASSPFAALWRMTKPVIGAVNGPCVTGGFELALACDLLVASERATFADTHARLGVVATWGLTALLPRAVGIRKAREMSITGNFSGPDSRENSARAFFVRRITDQSTVMVSTRWLSASTRPPTSKMRPRSGAM